jgi:hypothetical protein
VSREKDPGGFLDRWSARKRAAEAEAEAARSAGEPSVGADAEPSEAGSVGTEGAEAEALAAEALGAETAEADAEAIARLPSIDELTAETDLRPFLRRGVPAALKRAALRKMWTLNPAIRDYVDPARDYAWDWNTPGGVPGTGALSLPAAARALAALAGERPARPAPRAEEQRETDGGGACGGAGDGASGRRPRRRRLRRSGSSLSTWRPRRHRKPRRGGGTAAPCRGRSHGSSHCLIMCRSLDCMQSARGGVPVATKAGYNKKMLSR